MGDLIKLLQGKKTYIVAFVSATMGLVMSFGVVVPEWVFVVLGALGLTALRDGVKTVETQASAANEHARAATRMAVEVDGQMRHGSPGLN